MVVEFCHGIIQDGGAAGGVIVVVVVKAVVAAVVVCVCFDGGGFGVCVIEGAVIRGSISAFMIMSLHRDGH